jgi:hypothetical protein
MSGPIVRKYGFPNFENIFGKRELEHGVEDEATSPAESESESSIATEEPATAQGKAKAKAKTPRKKT